MTHFSHMTYLGSSIRGEVLVILVALVATFIGSAKAAEGEIPGDADSTNPLAITIDDAQVLRIQDVVVGSPVSGIVSSVAHRFGLI